jgi:hypothetical protein
MRLYSINEEVATNMAAPTHSDIQLHHKFNWPTFGFLWTLAAISLITIVPCSLTLSGGLPAGNAGCWSPVERFGDQPRTRVEWVARDHRWMVVPVVRPGKRYVSSLLSRYLAACGPSGLALARRSSGTLAFAGASRSLERQLNCRPIGGAPSILL